MKIIIVDENIYEFSDPFSIRRSLLIVTCSPFKKLSSQYKNARIGALHGWLVRFSDFQLFPCNWAGVISSTVELLHLHAEECLVYSCSTGITI